MVGPRAPPREDARGDEAAGDHGTALQSDTAENKRMTEDPALPFVACTLATSVERQHHIDSFIQAFTKSVADQLSSFLVRVESSGLGCHGCSIIAVCAEPTQRSSSSVPTLSDPSARSTPLPRGSRLPGLDMSTLLGLDGACGAPLLDRAVGGRPLADHGYPEIRGLSWPHKPDSTGHTNRHHTRGITFGRQETLDRTWGAGSAF